MRKLIIIIFLLGGCSANKNQIENDFSKIVFSDNMSLVEFQTKLKDYANNSPYPNIDN